MKLSDLIAYRNLLQTKALDPELKNITGRLEHLVHTVKNHPVQFENCTKDVEIHFDNVRRTVKGFHRELEALKMEIETQILRIERTYYQQSMQWFSTESQFETVEYILDRRRDISQDDREILSHRIRSHSDWRLPGLIIRPGREDFIDIMVSLDPLYVVDRDQALLRPALDRFPDVYQTRLRQYVIDDRTTNPIFGQLPQAQFGLIFAYNHFDFLPLEIIKRYLAEAYQLLRSGGSMIFTYNDCDQEDAVGSVENHFMCYTPGHHIRDAAISLGFEITKNMHGTQGLSWLEIKKPGKLTSRRGAQVLAKIYRI